MIEIPRFALSVRQPWAWALVNGYKPVENRDKSPISKMKTGCKIAIHASSGMTQDEYEDANHFMHSIGVKCPHPSELTRGGIVGIVTVDAKVNQHESPWFFGPYALVVSSPVALEEPIPAKGKLGYFKWEESGDIAEPKPWMKSWPEKPTRKVTALKKK